MTGIHQTRSFIEKEMNFNSKLNYREGLIVKKNNLWPVCVRMCVCPFNLCSLQVFSFFMTLVVNKMDRRALVIYVVHHECLAK